MKRYRNALLASFAAGLLAFSLTGCGGTVNEPSAGPPPKEPTTTDEVAVERVVERAKLNPADRDLVEAQEWCAVSTDERLGTMGPPVRLEIKGRPVFVCCKGCKKKAEADPDKTLAKVDELKAKAKAEKSAKN